MNETWAIIGLVLGPSGFVLFILAWIRDRKLKKAKIRYQDASSSKTDAEAEKLKAEAAQIKAKADESLTNTALNIAQRLNEECKLAKADLKEKDIMLDKTQEDLNSVRQSLEQALRKLESCQEELTKEKDKNQEMAQKNHIMELRIIELTEQLTSIRNGN